jgi:putative antitoxin of VapBC-like toxin-antitoxin system
MYKKHLKRTNLVLNADLLEEATRVLGAKTYSAAVNKALAEVLRIRRVLSLRSFSIGGFGWVTSPKCEKTTPALGFEERVRRRKRRNDPCGYHLNRSD